MLGRWHIMKNRYGADGITYDSVMDTAIGKIAINIRGNNRNEQTPPGEISPAQRRRLRGASNDFFGISIFFICYVFFDLVNDSHNIIFFHY